MKFIKKLMYIILVLLALGYAFVLVCSFNPDITKKLQHCYIRKCRN